MERTLSPEEKIKRAEDIYYRRKIQDYSKTYPRINVSKRKKNIGLLKRVFIQILVCIVIYTAVYIIQNKDFVFSEKTINKIKEILSYDLNINIALNSLNEYINLFINKNEETNDEIENETNNEEIKQEEHNESQELNGVGGENVVVQEEKVDEINKNNDNEENVLNSRKMIIPLTGIITSRFGLRDSQNPIVSKNHTGIDIAAQEGTVFISSMDGIVEEVSDKGELGNHVKITSDNISTVYAHCKTIYVEEGEKVSVGQELGEVGETGNATGPHLHFEIIKDNTYIDPELILKFE